MTNDAALTLAQEDAVRYMLRGESDGAALLAFDMGLGKTRTGLMFAKASEARVVLVVAPLQTLDDWAKTAAVEYPELGVSVIDSSKTGKNALRFFMWRQSGIYLIGHEYWERLAWKKQAVPKRRASDRQQFRKVDSGTWGGAGFLFIFDESHRSAASNWTNKALMNLDPDVFKLSMSGTYEGDKFDGAYYATKWLWPHRRDLIPANIFDWRAQWAKVEYDHFAPRNQKNTGEKEPGAFVGSLPCYIRMESDLPDAIEHEVWVDLYPEQRRVYDELDARMVAWIQDNPLVTEYSITKRARQRQVTLAYPTLTFDENDELVEVSYEMDAESVKIDQFFSDIRGENPDLGNLLVDEQLLILTDSQKFARLLTYRLNQEFGDVAREWSGPITRTERALNKQRFIDGDIMYLVGVQAAMGTGTDGLQYASHIVVTMSRADRRINNEQGIARLNRKGQTKPVHHVSYLANDTIDTGQLSAQMQAAIDAKRRMRARRKQ
jgi:hypothetical protein